MSFVALHYTLYTHTKLHITAPVIISLKLFMFNIMETKLGVNVSSFTIGGLFNNV